MIGYYSNKCQSHALCAIERGRTASSDDYRTFSLEAISKTLSQSRQAATKFEKKLFLSQRDPFGSELCAFARRILKPHDIFEMSTKQNLPAFVDKKRPLWLPLGGLHTAVR
jgi:hypothetical protein